MLVFDADTHLTLTEKPSQTADELVRNMDYADIDKALIWLQPPYMRVIDDANSYIYDSAKRYPDRLVPFGWVDPHFGIDTSMNMLKKCLDEYGMNGIKLNGAQNSFHIDDLSLEPIYNELEKRNSILALHVGADSYNHTHPYRVGKIANRHPNLKILLAHMGGAGLPDLGDSCVEIAQKHPNTMLIGSAISYIRILDAIHTLGADRVCFGSDAPFALQRVEVAAYYALLKNEIPDADLEKVMGLNIQRYIFG